MKRENIQKLFATTTIASVADVESTINAVVGRLFQLVLIVSVIAVIWSAYNFLFSGDDTEKLEKSKRILIYAVIATAVALLATSVPPLIASILNNK